MSFMPLDRIKDGESGDFVDPVEKRSHSAAYKHAQRRGILYQIALAQFEKTLPDMNRFLLTLKHL